MEQILSAWQGATVASLIEINATKNFGAPQNENKRTVSSRHRRFG